jgi:hypothetical protein
MPDGQFTYSIPIKVPAGRAGMQPTLSLEYASNGGDGLLGMGWSLSGLSSITRCGWSLAVDGRVDGVDFDETDRFCLDGSKLVAVSGPYGAHGTETASPRSSRKTAPQKVRCASSCGPGMA